MGTRALKRGVLLVPSNYLLEAGRPDMKMSKAAKAGGLMQLRHPASNLFYE